jgi:hypothetical protein
MRLLSATVHVWPLAEGYLWLDAASTDQTVTLDLIRAANSRHKTVVFSRPQDGIASRILPVAGCRWIGVSGEQVQEIGPDNPWRPAQQPATLFLISEDFMMRRYLHARAQARNLLFYGQESLPVQTVRFLGVPPRSDWISPELAGEIKDAGHLVLFDRTRKTILPDISDGPRVHTLTYVYESFAPNLRALNSVLGDMHRAES